MIRLRIRWKNLVIEGVEELSRLGDEFGGQITRKVGAACFDPG